MALYPVSSQDISTRSSRSSGRRHSRCGRCCPCRRRPCTCPPDTSIRTRRRLRHGYSWSLAHRDISLSTALLAFDTHDHVVLFPQLETGSFPGTEMVACIDGASAMHLGANGPILLEICVIADDGRCVGALLLPDLVCRAVAVERAEVVGTCVV
jgi:hypothetical protein